MLTRFVAGVLAGATLAVAMPAVAQSPAADARFRAAQERFDREYRVFREEADRYQDSVRRDDDRYAPPIGAGPRVPDPRYDGADYGPDAYERDEGNYDPARYYRAGPTYQERVLASDDRVYRGRDGRYYCKRNDGTTGLIVGAAAGGILGNVIDGGRSRIVGTLLGGAAGALAGKSIDQNSSQVRCR